MTEGQITTALEMHGIEWVRTTEGAIMAWEPATMIAESGVIDASEWIFAPTTKSGMLAWLGY